MCVTDGRYAVGNGAWVVWHYDQSYRQEDVHVFADELDALRWSQAHKDHGYVVTFVRFGGCPKGCPEDVADPDAKDSTPEVVYGALARAEALAAGHEDWMNVTRWPLTKDSGDV